MIRGITQYEVYAYEAGRWSLHARYPGAQRLDAINDADVTERLTGNATKVVRDTYFPDENRNEEVTAYLSPKAKELRARSSSRGRQALARGSGVVRTAVMHPSRRRPQKTSRVLATVRLVVAIGTALLVATSLTATLSWALNRLPADFAVQDGTIGIVLTTAYLLVFMFVFPRCFRARWRIHQALADMWENADRPKRETLPQNRRANTSTGAPAGQPWVFPNERRPQELQQPIPVAPSELTLELESAKAAKAAAAEKAIDKAAKEVVPPPPELDTPKKKEEPAKAEKEKKPEKKAEPEKEKKKEPAPIAAETPAEPQMVFTPGIVPEIPEGLSLERIILRRFAVDVVMPSIARNYRDDPVTRRGVGLLLAGAVEQLSKSTSMTSHGAMALLAEALRESGAKAAAIESFLGNYQASLTAANAKPLLAAGRDAIAGYVDGAKGIERIIQQALAVWRFPSTARLVKPKPEFYLFSIAREESLSDGEPTVGLLLQHAIVRAAVHEFVGEEIPHDGAGILVRFDDAQAAFTAARAMQSRIQSAAGPSTATVIVGGTGIPPGPDGTALVLERVRNLLNVTVDGEIVCDTAVHESLDGAKTNPAFTAVPVANHSDAMRLIEPAHAG